MTPDRAIPQGENLGSPSVLSDLRPVLNAIPDLLLVLDATGRVLSWNERVTLTAGVPERDLLYTSLTVLLHEEDRAAVERALSKALTEGHARVAARWPATAPTPPVFDWSVTAVGPVLGQRTGLVVVGRERTGHRPSTPLLELEMRFCRFIASDGSREDLLAELAGWLERVFDGRPCAVFVRGPDGAQLRPVASPGLPPNALAHLDRVSADGVLGVRSEAPSGSAAVIVRDLATAPEWEPCREVALRHGLQTCWLAPIQSASGETIGALAVYQPGVRQPSAAERLLLEGAAVLTQGALERHAAKERLEISEEHHRLLYDGHPSLYLMVADDLTILSANRFGAGQLGFQVEDLIGRPATDLFHVADREALRQGLSDCFAHPGFICKWEFRQYAKDGRLRWVRVSASVPQGSNGRPRALLVCEDITAQKRQADELVNAKNRFESFMRNLPGLACVKDEAGRCIFANAAFERVFQLRPDDWYGKTYADLFPADLAERFSERDRAVLASGEPLIFSETTRWNGEEREWLVVKFPISDSSGQRLVGGIALDMTEQRQAERRLRESHALLSAVMAATVDAVCLKDAQGIYLLVNDAYGRMVGKPLSEIIGRRAADLFPPAIAEQVDAHDRLVMEQGHSLTFEQTVEIAGMRRVLLTIKSPFRDGQGRVTGVVGISRDITERMHAEERLRRNEARFRSLIQHASDITTLLDRDGVIQYESPAFYRIFGYSDGEVVGRSLFELIHPEDLPHAKAAFSVTVHRPGTSAPVEFRMRKADGTYLMVEAVGNNLLDDPSVGGIVLNSRDVTERHRLAEQLRQAQKMEAIGRLAGGIAHDFNNILTVISGYSEVILRRAELVDALRKPVEEIRKAASRAATLTSQLLSFSRQQVLKRQVLNLNDVILDALDMLQRLVGPHVRFVTELDADLRRVSADPTQIEQVLMNLAINARDAMPEGGTVWIETRNLSQVPPAVRVTVRDNGKGMDAETLSRAFEPFFTTKARGQGTGLGLAMVYGIITQHGGTITADSVPGRGTIFVIDLPCAREGSALLESAPVSASASPAAGTVLVVDDEDGVREFVSDALRAEGYRVLTARNGDEALARYEAAEDVIDVLLADMIMPGINGRQLGERLRRTRPGLKVVLMSGYTDDSVLRKGEGGNAAFLQKPFKIDALFEVLRQELLQRDAGDA